MFLGIDSANDSEIRALCKQKIESLEHWLRRIIEETLTVSYGDYFNFEDASGNRIVRKEILEKVKLRRKNEPVRYPRNVDAILLEDAVDLICKPSLYKAHFAEAFKSAFPDGNAEARTFLTRLLLPRNNLSHANAISIRQAEQIICYTNDIIDSLKEYYQAMGKHQDFNVPLILKVTDSFGNTFTRNQCSQIHDGGISINYLDQDQYVLRPGDTVSFEIEVDPSFERNTYEIIWGSTKPWSTETISETKVLVPISNRQVGQQFDVQCRIVSKQDWHRMHMGADDFLMVYLKVLPPLR